MPGIGPHHIHDLLAFALQRLQVVTVDLDGKLAFHAAHRLFHVVGNGLRKIPKRAGNLEPVRDPWLPPILLCSGETPDANSPSVSDR